MRTLTPLSMRADAHALAGALDDFLGIDGVGAGRHRRAGHDAQRLAGAAACPSKTAPAARSPTTVELARARGGDVGAADGVAVDGGVVGRRHVERRLDVVGQHAAERARDRHAPRHGTAPAIRARMCSCPSRTEIMGAIIRAMDDASPPRPAGFWIRAVALAIDLVVFALVQRLVRGAGAGRCWAPASTATARRARRRSSSRCCSRPSTRPCLHAVTGQTIGKSLVGVRVVGADGTPLTVGPGIPALSRLLHLAHAARLRLPDGRRCAATSARCTT